MQRPLLIAAVLALFGGISSAKADIAFELLYSDSFGNTAIASLQAVDQLNGSYLVTSGSLNITGGGAVGTYLLWPGGPSPTISPLGLFQFDNLLFPSGNPFINDNGLLFVGGGTEVNIYRNPNQTYSLWTGNSAGYQVTGDNGSITLSSVPEPASTTMLGLACVSIGGYLRFRRKQLASVPV